MIFLLYLIMICFDLLFVCASDSLTCRKSMNCIFHCFGIGALSFLQFVLQSFVYLMVMLYHL